MKHARLLMMAGLVLAAPLQAGAADLCGTLAAITDASLQDFQAIKGDAVDGGYEVKVGLPGARTCTVDSGQHFYTCDYDGLSLRKSGSDDVAETMAKFQAAFTSAVAGCRPDLVRKDSQDLLGVTSTVFVDDKGQRWIDITTRYAYVTVEIVNGNRFPAS